MHFRTIATSYQHLALADIWSGTQEVDHNLMATQIEFRSTISSKHNIPHSTCPTFRLPHPTFQVRWNLGTHHALLWSTLAPLGFMLVYHTSYLTLQLLKMALRNSTMALPHSSTRLPPPIWKLSHPQCLAFTSKCPVRQERIRMATGVRACNYIKSKQGGISYQY